MQDFKDFLALVEDAPTTTAGVATNPTPSFSVSRLQGKAQYTVKGADYQKIFKGRERGQKWASHGLPEDMSSAIRKSLYNDGGCHVTCEETGTTITLTHDRMKRVQRQVDLDSYTSE